KAGGIGIDGAPQTTFAPSSKPRVTCSTTWLGDHFPGARGVVQVAADLSAAATRSRWASRLAASASLTSAMRPPVREARSITPNPPSRRPSTNLCGGAGYGDRTRVRGLGSLCTTLVLSPQWPDADAYSTANQRTDSFPTAGYVSTPRRTRRNCVY